MDFEVRWSRVELLNIYLPSSTFKHYLPPSTFHLQIVTIPLMRHFLSLADLSREEISKLLEKTKELKADRSQRGDLAGKKMAMLFEKPSLRTRVSFELAMHELGGYALSLSPAEVGLGKREAIKDVAKVLSRYVDVIMARVFSHEDLLELAKHSEVPVINGLSDFEHPCQGLSDLFTIFEHFSGLDPSGIRDLKLAYVGDGNNNVCHSLMFGASKVGIKMVAASPEEYKPQKEVMDATGVLVLGDPEHAVRDADIAYTDTWVSMGDEKEEEKRLRDFRGYQVNQDLMALAKPQAVFMHCLPAHRGQEVTDEVIDSPQSIVYTQAENRLHTQKAILLWVLGV